MIVAARLRRRPGQPGQGRADCAAGWDSYCLWSIPALSARLQRAHLSNAARLRRQPGQPGQGRAERAAQPDLALGRLAQPERQRQPRLLRRVPVAPLTRSGQGRPGRARLSPTQGSSMAGLSWACTTSGSWWISMPGPGSAVRAAAQAQHASWCAPLQSQGWHWLPSAACSGGHVVQGCMPSCVPCRAWPHV